MKNRSLVTKIVVMVCSLVAILLVSASAILIRFEIRRESRLAAQYLREINQAVLLRESDAAATLVNTVAFNSAMLGRILGRLLDDDDLEAVFELLPRYLEYPEFLAIQAFKAHVPVAAAWKVSGGRILTADALPADLTFEDAARITADALHHDAIVGKITLYYTDAHVRHNITANREVNAAREAGFREDSQRQLQRAIAGQLIGVLVILLVMVATLTLFLRRAIRAPLRKIAAVARRLSALDLTVRLNGNSGDEIGLLFAAIDEMARSFTDTVGLMQQSGQQVFASAAELAVTAEQHEQTMARQVDSTNRAAASVANIACITDQLVQTIRNVTAMAQEAAEFANRGQSDLFRMEEAMRKMEDASASISEKLETINAKADRITTVVSTINKVSEQTNLLSLNAAIEAEKAGEYGRGFAVVAREIRRLADHTAVATLDIGRMVQEMQSAMSAGVAEMDTFIADVRRSTDDVGRISMQLTLIIDQVQALSPNFEIVSAAIGQQSDDARDISALMDALSTGMEETRQALRESFEAIAHLKEAAHGLQAEVSKFQVR